MRILLLLIPISLVLLGVAIAAFVWAVKRGQFDDLDRALAREPGVLDCGANAVTGRIRITWDPSRTALSVPLRRLAMLGYRPYLAGSEALERERTRERRRWLLRLGIAGLGMFQAMMMAEALYLDFDSTMPEATRDFFRWLTFLLCAPVVFYSGWPFLAGAARELRQRRLGMDFLSSWAAGRPSGCSSTPWPPGATPASCASRCASTCARTRASRARCSTATPC